jgi:signal transduction histidine kinase
VHPEDRVEFAGNRRKSMESEGNWGFEYRLLNDWGKITWIYVTAAPMFNIEGARTGYVISNMDITSRKTAEESVIEREKLLNDTQRMTKAGGWEWNVDTATMTWTEETYRIHGMEPGDIETGSSDHIRRSLACYDEKDRVLIHAAFLNCIQSGEPFDIEAPLNTIDGRRLWIRTNGQAVWSNGRVVRVTGNLIDITINKKREEELRQINEELKRFSYAVSHDLKSPLITISAYLNFLQEDINKKDEERISNDMSHIQSAVYKMGKLLEELQEFSRIGRIMNAVEEVTFQEIATDAIHSVAGRIMKSGADVQIMKDEVNLLGDRISLMRIWQNLIENSVKYMGSQKAPCIVIGVQQKPQGTVFYVKDNGNGIDPQYHQKIFGLFEKLDPKSDGSGLGLAMVKRIVELYNGSVWVESQGEGKGACFYFTLPSAIKADASS